MLAAPAPSPSSGRVGGAPSIPGGDVLTGQLPPSQRITVTLAFKPQDQAALTTFIADLSDRTSPLFRHYLTPAEFGQRFGASLATIHEVSGVLSRFGLRPGSVPPDRLSLAVTGTVSQIEAAFSVQLQSYRTARGRDAFAPNRGPLVPDPAAVQAVLGLDTLVAYRPLLVGRRAKVATALPSGQPPAPGGPGPQPCSAAASVASSGYAYTADEISDHYGMWPLYGLGDLGAGIHVALVELEPNLTSDISAYESCYGISTTVNYIPVDGFNATGSGSGEAAADIEDVIGLAPQAVVDVYQAPNTGEYQDFQAIFNANQDQVVSTSWGACEPAVGSNEAQAEQALFEQAATQGQTVLAAAGDSGSTGCLGQLGAPYSSQLWVEDPASQPYVVGVGGTSLPSTGVETVWNDSGTTSGAGGGGLSGIWCMPAYQYQSAIPGLIGQYSQTNSGCPSSSPYIRQVPDVSADADPQTGYAFYFQGSWNVIAGGTSLAAPTWAATAAMTDGSPFCSAYGSGAPGALPQGLYPIAASPYYPNAFNDVTSGNNDYTPSGYSGGAYPATSGYDMASGLGTPQLMDYSSTGTPSYFYPGLAALQCYAYRASGYADTVTSVSPNSAFYSAGATVTIQGTGFVPVAGADLVVAGSVQVAASCSSTTTCTVTLPPAASQGTVDLRVEVEDLAESAVTTSDQFTWTSNVPGPPVGLAAVPQAGAAELSWSPPNSSGTSTISSYQVTGTDLTTSQQLTPKVVSGTPVPTSTTISGLTDGDSYSFQVAATNASGTGPASTPVQTQAPSLYAPLTPARICDTRPVSESGAPADQCTGETLGPGGSLQVQVTGYGGVPASATAVVANVTVTDTTAASYLTVWPAGGSRPLASNLNWSPGQTLANLVTLPLSSGGAIEVYNANGSADVVVDVEGYYGPMSGSAGLGFSPLTPARICDTRPVSESGAAADQCTGETLGPGGSIEVQVSGYGGVPASATAVVANITVTDTTAYSYLTAWPLGQTRPLASTLNWSPGETRANRVVIPLSASGALQFYNDLGAADLVVDVNGYYSSSSPDLFEAVSPFRICDTRSTAITGQPQDQCTGSTLGPSATLPVQVSGLAGVPAGAAAVVANVTATDTTAASYLTVYPEAPQPLASDLNWGQGYTVPNLVVCQLSPQGGLQIYNDLGQVDVVVDVFGWFT